MFGGGPSLIVDALFLARRGGDECEAGLLRGGTGWDSLVIRITIIGHHSTKLGISPGL
jgi:hypothetical protein